jgi:NAD(P)-dependent dehydrogenase (short-subunit alcohol dehydrogenase family)
VRLGKDVTAVNADISKLKDLDRLFGVVKEKHGRIDVLFANAGVASFIPLEKISEESFDAVFDINAKGTFFTVQKAIPLLARGASVILTTSIANQEGRPNVVAYSGSKAAVRAFARGFSAELVHRGIRVNALSPGATETPIFGKRNPPDQVKAMIERLNATVPLKRIAQPEDIAKVALFLASDDSIFLLGEEIVADGGVTNLPS